MEVRIKVVFELSKLSDVDEKNVPTWMEFISNFIIDANNRCDFYFLLDTTDVRNMTNYKATLNNEKTKILNIISSKKADLKEDNLKFGLFNDITKMEDKHTILFYDLDNEQNTTELNNNDSFFFFSNYDIGEVLHYSEFFIFLLDFENLNDDQKKKKKLSKFANGYVDKDNYTKINYDQVSYEFLTFVENKNKI